MLHEPRTEEGGELRAHRVAEGGGGVVPVVVEGRKGGRVCVGSSTMCADCGLGAKPQPKQTPTPTTPTSRLVTNTHAYTKHAPEPPNVAPKHRDEPADQPFFHRDRRGCGCSTVFCCCCCGGGCWWGQDEVGGGEEDQRGWRPGLVGGRLPEHEGQAGEACVCGIVVGWMGEW